MIKLNYKLRNNFSKTENCLNEILMARGVEDVERFLYPTEQNELDPYLLNNIEKGRDLLVKHLKANSKILFVIDCDADGFTSSSILWLYIKSVYPQANLFFTVHEEKQHGLEDKIDWLEEDEHYDLVILPDASSYDVEYHQRLEMVGTDVLCIDHHEQLFDENKNPITSNGKNVVVINNQLSDRYDNKSLCGAGVVYKFCQVLDHYFNISIAKNFIDLVALGEISDVMFQGTSETRYLIMKGLSNIKNKGFQSLLEAQSFSLKEKAECPFIGLTPVDVAFYVSPLINAITRVGTVAEKELMFLGFVDPMREVKSTKRGAKPYDKEYACRQLGRIAGNIRNRQNREKEKAIDLLEQRVFKEGLTENNILVIEVFEEDKIRKTLTGLIAAHFVSKFNRPCLIGRMSDDGFLRGSMRSNNNFESLPNFKEYLEKTDMFEYIAGHTAAAGYSLPEKNINNFISFSNRNLNSEDFRNCYSVDYIFDSSENEIALVGKIIGKAENCFGNGVDEVKVAVKNIPLTNYFLMGTDKSTVKISYNGIDYIAFKNDNFAEEVKENSNKKINIISRFKLNTWAGKTTVQCIIEDYEFVESEDRFSF